MDRQLAKSMAVELMNEWDCDGWKFKWSNGKRQLGAAVTRYHPRTREVISQELRLSRYLVDLNDEDVVRDVILHEIAHIKAGPENGHNQVWKAWCLRVGAKPERCADKNSVNFVAAPFELVCSLCGNRNPRFKRLKFSVKNYGCKICGKKSFGKMVFQPTNGVAQNQ